MCSHAGPPPRCRPGARRAACGLALVALGLLLPARAGAQQERPGGEPRPGNPAPPAAPPQRPGPKPPGPATDRGTPLPAPADSAERRPRGAVSPEAVDARPAWTFNASGRADVGYDTNVFQSDSATGDAFSELGATAGVSRDDGRSLIRARLDLERRFYRRFSRADEFAGLADLTGARQLGPLRAGAVLSASYLDLRVLDREGNLLPRSNFASFSSRGIAFADLRLSRQLYLSAEGSYRWKNYEETGDLTSLDYAEWLAKLGATRYLPARLSIRIQGGLGQRDYRDLRSAEPSGTSAPGNPLLELRKVDGEARLRKRWGERGLAQATFGVRRSDDLFRDELSSDQLSGSLQLRHGAGGWLLDLYGALVHRDFDVRRSSAGTALEETYFSMAVELQRDLWRGARVSGGYELFRRSTTDLSGDYTVGTWQLGLVHAF